MAEELLGISFEESLDLFIYFSCRNLWRGSFCVSLISAALLNRSGRIEFTRYTVEQFKQPKLTVDPSRGRAE